MAALEIKPKAGCRWDLVSLGEVMLRLDPGEGRVATARRFDVWEGGGEYNVARGLSHCFGLATAIVTALADNPVGRLVENLIRQGGVDGSQIRWRPYDGIGRAVRNGLNFTERGFGVRGAQGCSDRGHTAVSQLKDGDIDWEALFRRDGARWFHTGGIFAALSDTTPAVAREAMAAARRHGAIVSYDLNYRESLWRSRGGRAGADEMNRELIGLCDVLFGAAEPLEDVAREFPHLKFIATTVRNTRSATRNDWGGACWADGVLHRAAMREGLEVLDRVGSGDAFAAGVIYGLLAGKGEQYAVDCGVAHGALAMTVPGDQSMATLAEVEKLMAGGGAAVAR